jgi:hypothetical protein
MRVIAARASVRHDRIACFVRRFAAAYLGSAKMKEKL